MSFWLRRFLLMSLSLSPHPGEACSDAEEAPRPRKPWDPHSSKWIEKEYDSFVEIFPQPANNTNYGIFAACSSTTVVAGDRPTLSLVTCSCR